MPYVDPGHHLEEFPGHVTETSDAARRHVELARIRFGVSDELRNRCGRNRWVHHHDVGPDNNTGDRRDVTDEIEIQLVVERSVDRLCRTDREQRVAVGGRAHDGLGGDVGTAARPVLDDEWLAETLRQPLSHEACDDVTGTASRKADDDAHRPRWIGLRPSNMRHGRERGSARGQMQECAAGKFHSALPAFRAMIPFQLHSGLMLAARITLPHFSVSSAMSLPKSTGEPGSAVAPHSASRAFILGSARAALISVLSLSTISAGVFFGAPTPLQKLDS